MIVDWDADSAVYKIAFRNEGKLQSEAVNELDNYISQIIGVFNPEQFNMWLSLDYSIRKEIYPDYKWKRKPRPEHYEILRKRMHQHGARYAPMGLEADDILAIRYRNFAKEGMDMDEYLIVSIDKDLNTVPGWHHNPDKEVTYYVEPEDAFMFLMCQMIMGDTVDCITGVRGLGSKWCIENLDYDMEENEIIREVKRAYIDWSKNWHQEWEMAKQLYDKNLFLLSMGLGGDTVNVMLDHIENILGEYNGN